MSVMALEMFGYALAAYAGIGLIAAAVLLAGPIARLDQQAAAAPLRVKLLWTPGLAALWPLALIRVAGVRAPEDRG